jgi:hypothetical protein
VRTFELAGSAGTNYVVARAALCGVAQLELRGRDDGSVPKNSQARRDRNWLGNSTQTARHSPVTFPPNATIPSGMVGYM